MRKVLGLQVLKDTKYLSVRTRCVKRSFSSWFAFAYWLVDWLTNSITDITNLCAFAFTHKNDWTVTNTKSNAKNNSRIAQNIFSIREGFWRLALIIYGEQCSDGGCDQSSYPNERCLGAKCHRRYNTSLTISSQKLYLLTGHLHQTHHHLNFNISLFKIGHQYNNKNNQAGKCKYYII